MPSALAGGTPTPRTTGPLAWFEHVMDHCYDYAVAAKAAGRPVVGIMCEYTPREIIDAAGAVSVCLCGGSLETIGPAEAHLPSNLCPLIKSTYGYHVMRSNPFLEMADLVVAETTCDGKKKMFELMGQTRPMHILELPQKPAEPAATEHWKSELWRLRRELERRFNVTITDERLSKSIRTMNAERRLRRQLAGLMRADRPPLTGTQLLALSSSIWGLPAAQEQYQAAYDLLSIAPAVTGLAPARAGSPVRVLMTGVPTPRGAERVVELIESRGGLVVCMETCSGVKPLLEDVSETGGPMDALAAKYLHLPCSVMTPNDARMESLRKLAVEYRAQCIIELVWQACLTYDVESHRVRHLAENELHLPYLKLSTDYSPNDSARLAVRIEALFETVAITTALV